MAQRISLSDYWLETQRIIAVSQGMFPISWADALEGLVARSGGKDSDDLSWEDLRDREFEDDAVYDDGQETCEHLGCFNPPSGDCSECGTGLCQEHLKDHRCGD